MQASGRTCLNLGRPPPGRGADARSRRQGGKRHPMARDEDVTRVFPLRKGDEEQVRRGLRGEVFGGVNGGVDRPSPQRRLQTGGKDAAAADDRQGRGLVRVAFGANDDRLNVQVRGEVAQAVPDAMSLLGGERAAARAEPRVRQRRAAGAHAAGRSCQRLRSRTSQESGVALGLAGTASGIDGQT